MKTPQDRILTADRLTQIAEMLTPAGLLTNDITAALGFSANTRTAALLRILVESGRAFAASIAHGGLRYFPTIEARDAFVPVYREEMAARRLQRCAEASRRYRGSVNPMAARQPKPAKPKAEIRTRRVKPMPGLEKTIVTKGTRTAVTPKLTGPARHAGLVDMSGAKITRYPTPPSRYATDTAPSVISASECRPWAEAVRP